ncbi:MAG: two-component regulator propeller domain-containing protein, partial [Verrucomicrobiota bacterium]
MSLPRWIRLGRMGLLLGSALLYCAVGGTDLRAASRSIASGEPFEVWPVAGDWQPNSVTAILQSHDGYLWLGTFHGLVRFDGVSFTLFDSGNTPSLQDGRITSLYETPDRTLWIGHETGQLTRLVNGQFHSTDLGSNWPGGVIEVITNDEQGDVWLLNDSGILFRVRDGQVTRTPGGASSVAKASLTRAKDGRLWMASNGKVATLDRGNVVPVVFP